MSIENITRLLCHLNQFAVDEPGSAEDGFSFIWHGGEPFMVPLEHYEEIGRLQRTILGPLNYQNFVQTNLTILTERHIEWIRSGRFFAHMGVGFSFDVYGDQRRDLRGRATSSKIMGNLQLLLDNKIRASGITVLSSSTRPHLRNIFHFFDNLGLDFRLLPYHLETNPMQTSTNGVAPNDIAAAMCELFDLWCQSEDPITISPLNDYTEDAISFINNRKNFYYNKAVNEHIFIIDTNGDLCGHETYMSEHRYGNLFEQPLGDILRSETRRRLVTKAARRMEQYCANCEFFGACSGFPVAEASPMEEQWLSRDGCYVAKILSHIVGRLTNAGLGLLPGTAQSGDKFVAM